MNGSIEGRRLGGRVSRRRALSDEDAALIRACAEERRRLLDMASQLTRDALAEKFGVDKKTISKVLTGRYPYER